MKDRIRECLSLCYSTYIVPDITTENEPCYIAYHPELEGCMSHGRTPEEAVQSLTEATELYISTLLEMGLEVPSPISTISQVTMTWAVIEQPTFVEEDNYISPSYSPPVFAAFT